MVHPVGGSVIKTSTRVVRLLAHLGCKLVRPKASNENLAAALAFANIVIVRISKENVHMAHCACTARARGLYTHHFVQCVRRLRIRDEAHETIGNGAVSQMPSTWKEAACDHVCCDNITGVRDPKNKTPNSL